ncbi:hypothetical protein BN14_01376 [Rhizoctonia solani AG-1 IB]|nr:hypothetical protein BN14_01376 [Rhizoctonia solani AG-1 IB]
MLEATLTTIRDLRIGTPLTAPRSIITEVRPTVGDNLTQASPVDGEIEMDVERTEAARVARQGSSVTPTAQPQPVGPQQQRPSSIQPSEIPQQVGTPTQPTSFAQQQDSPQRKRQRTLTSGSMEPLPRDHILHAHVSLVANTYRIEAARSASNSGDSATGQKQLVCKLCE